MHRSLATFTAAAFLVLTGCKDVAGPVSEDAYLGRWVLQSMNGQELPVIIASNANLTVELLTDDLVLERDGTLKGFSEIRIRYSDGRVEPGELYADGQWARFGSQIRLMPNGVKFADLGEIQDGVLRLRDADSQVVYQR